MEAANAVPTTVLSLGTGETILSLPPILVIEGACGKTVLTKKLKALDNALTFPKASATLATIDLDP